MTHDDIRSERSSGAEAPSVLQIRFTSHGEDSSSLDFVYPEIYSIFFLVERVYYCEFFSHLNQGCKERGCHMVPILNLIEGLYCVILGYINKTDLACICMYKYVLFDL